jgi:hypothetical protein
MSKTIILNPEVIAQVLHHNEVDVYILWAISKLVDINNSGIVPLEEIINIANKVFQYSSTFVYKIIDKGVDKYWTAPHGKFGKRTVCLFSINRIISRLKPEVTRSKPVAVPLSALQSQSKKVVKELLICIFAARYEDERPVAINTISFYTGQSESTVRNAIKRSCDDLSNHYYASQTIGIPTSDGVHWTEAGHEIVASRLVQFALYDLGVVAYGQGPYISNFSIVDSTHIDLTITQRGGTDIVAPVSAYTGFSVLGSGVSITDAQKQATNTIRLTISGNANDVVAVYYLYGGIPAYSDPVVDNSAYNLPLEWILFYNPAFTTTTTTTTPAPTTTLPPADYPDAIFSPNWKENRPDITRDLTKTKVIYAEDLNDLNSEVILIETELGTNPKGSFSDIKARIVAIETRLTNHGI